MVTMFPAVHDSNSYFCHWHLEIGQVLLQIGHHCLLCAVFFTESFPCCNCLAKLIKLYSCLLVFLHSWCLHVLYLYSAMLIFDSDVSVFRLQLSYKDVNGMKQRHQLRIMSVARWWIGMAVVQAWEATVNYIMAIQILVAISQVGDIRAWMHNRTSETKRKHSSHASRTRMHWNLSKSLCTVNFQYVAACAYISNVYCWKSSSITYLTYLSFLARICHISMHNIVTC